METFSFSGRWAEHSRKVLGYEKGRGTDPGGGRDYLNWADEKVYGLEDMEAIDEIRAKSIRANLKLIECPIRHLGTEEGYKIYARLQKHLEENRVEIRFMTMVQNILMEKGRQSGVVKRKRSRRFMRRRSWAGVEREGSEWFSHI